MQQKLETAESLAASLAGVGDAHGIERYGGGAGVGQGMRFKVPGP